MIGDQKYVLKSRSFVTSGEFEFEKKSEPLVIDYLKNNVNHKTISLKAFVEGLERNTLHKALEIAEGNQRLAANLLGIKPTTLHEKIKKYKLIKADKRESIKDLLNSRLNVS